VATAARAMATISARVPPTRPRSAPDAVTRQAAALAGRPR